MRDVFQVWHLSHDDISCRSCARGPNVRWNICMQFSGRLAPWPILRFSTRNGTQVPDFSFLNKEYLREIYQNTKFIKLVASYLIHLHVPVFRRVLNTLSPHNFCCWKFWVSSHTARGIVRRSLDFAINKINWIFLCGTLARRDAFYTPRAAILSFPYPVPLFMAALPSFSYQLLVRFEVACIALAQSAKCASDFSAYSNVNTSLFRKTDTVTTSITECPIRLAFK